MSQNPPVPPPAPSPPRRARTVLPTLAVLSPYTPHPVNPEDAPDPLPNFSALSAQGDHEKLFDEIDRLYSQMTISIGVVQGDILEITEEIVDLAEQEDVLASASEEVRIARDTYHRIRSLLKLITPTQRKRWYPRLTESQQKLQRAIDDLTDLEQMARMTFDGRVSVIRFPEFDMFGQPIADAQFDSQQPPHQNPQPTFHSQPPTYQPEQHTPQPPPHPDYTKQRPDQPAFHDFPTAPQDPSSVSLQTMELAHTELQAVFAEIKSCRRVVDDAKGAAQQQSAFLDMIDAVQIARGLFGHATNSFRALEPDVRKPWKARLARDRKILASFLSDLNTLEQTERGDSNVPRPFVSRKSVRFTGLSERSPLNEPIPIVSQAAPRPGTDLESRAAFRSLLVDLEEALEDMSDCEEDEQDAWMDEIDNGIQKAWSLNHMLADFSDDMSSESESRAQKEDDLMRLKHITNAFDQFRSPNLSTDSATPAKRSSIADTDAARLHAAISLEIANLTSRIAQLNDPGGDTSQVHRVQEIEEKIASIKEMYGAIQKRLKELDTEGRAELGSMLKEDRAVLEKLNAEFESARSVTGSVVTGPSDHADDGTRASNETTISTSSTDLTPPEMPQVAKIYNELKWICDALNVDIRTIANLASTSYSAGQLEIVDGRMDDALELYSHLKSEVLILPIATQEEWMTVMRSVKIALSSLTKAYVNVKLNLGNTRRSSRVDGPSISARLALQTELAILQLEAQQPTASIAELSLPVLEKDLMGLARALKKNVRACRLIHSLDVAEGLFDDCKERLGRTRDIYDVLRDRVRRLPDEEYELWEPRARAVQDELKSAVKQIQIFQEGIEPKSQFAKYSEPSYRIQDCDQDLAQILDLQLGEIDGLFDLSPVIRAFEAAEVPHRVGRTKVLLDRCLQVLGNMSLSDQNRWLARLEYQQKRVKLLHSRSSNKFGFGMDGLLSFTPRDLEKVMRQASQPHNQSRSTRGKPKRSSGLFRIPLRSTPRRPGGRVNGHS